MTSVAAVAGVCRRIKSRTVAPWALFFQLASDKSNNQQMTIKSKRTGPQWIMHSSLMQINAASIVATAGGDRGIDRWIN
ncbi:hypothetical protein FHY35_001748 [Xanthomonas arboricola]|uniref:hypothetical protein n=1 Tax=Xanthomonas arboricola TaxID=56448 RepID=UPI00141BD65E|nr:hypothetical protein [Xanthomonas arboricola]NIJ84793.1 hypothetical protein [Xanthomonas arboricola]